MDFFDDSDDDIIEIPLFQRIKTAANLVDSGAVGLPSIDNWQPFPSTSVTTAHIFADETLTLDSDDSNIADSHHNDGHIPDAKETNDLFDDSLEVIYCSPSKKNSIQTIGTKDLETNSGDISSDDSTPVKASFINRTLPIQKPIQKKTKTPIQKVPKSPKNVDINKKTKAMVAQEEKARQKEKDRMNKEVLMSTALKNAIKYCFAIIDRELYNLIEESLVELFNQKECNYRIADSPAVPMSVTWIRKHLKLVETSDSPSGSTQSSQSSIATTEVAEKHMILVMNVNDFVARVVAYKTKSGHNFYDLIQEVTRKTIVNNITIVALKVEQYFKRQKNKSDQEYRRQVQELDKPTSSQNTRRQRRDSMPSITKEEMEMAIIDMEVRVDSTIKVSIIKVKDYTEVSKVIYRMTRAVAELTAKKDSNHNFSWYVEGDNRNCVNPVDNPSRLELWKHQLMQFPKLSKPIATAIANQYPSPMSLLNAYKSQPNPELLLADMVVSRPQPNGTTSERKIGPELSQRIHLFMTSNDSQKFLNQF